VTLPVITTERLRLEPVVDDHLPLLTSLNADPEVMRFILGRPATAEETAAEWRRRLDHQSDAARGLGYWVGSVGAEPVGWWSASAFEPDPTRAGLGYRLVREAWGRGLATEGARAMVDQAFADAQVQVVSASTMAVNTASRRVLEKTGLRHTGTWVQEWAEPIPGAEHGDVGYDVTRAQWAARG
jgi:RimJ/RimL family protein N-acetyltransferase